MARVAVAGRVARSGRAAASGRVAPPKAQNLFAWSEDLSQNPPWNVGSCTRTGGQPDPFGGTGATLLVADGTTTTHQYLSNVTASTADAGRMLTRSAYFKAAPGQTNWIWFGVNNGATGFYFDPVLGAFAGTPPSGYSTRVAAIGNGWYRASVTYPAVVSTSERIIICQGGNSSSLTGWSGSGQGVLTYGQQLVQGPYQGPYQRTTGSAVNTGAMRAPP